jgi:hypothetical protein
MRVRVSRRDAELQFLALFRRHVQRAEDPVPQRKATAQVLVEVRRIGRVMNLMMRGAQENAAERAAEDDPDMRMLQVHVQMDERDQHDVGAGQRILISGGAPKA